MEYQNLYPKTIEELLKRIDFIINNDENFERRKNMENWKEWFLKLEYKLDIELEKHQYLRAFSKGHNFALQVWCHKEIVNAIEYNLIANYYSDFNIEKTKMV